MSDSETGLSWQKSHTADDQQKQASGRSTAQDSACVHMNNLFMIWLLEDPVYVFAHVNAKLQDKLLPCLWEIPNMGVGVLRKRNTLN